MAARGSQSPVFLLPRQDLDRANLVFVGVVTVHAVDVEVGVRITLPAPAQINRLVDPPDLIIAGDGQANRIILAVTDVGYVDLAQDRREKRPRRAQAVDPQRIVSPSRPRPFPGTV